MPDYPDDADGRALRSVAAKSDMTRPMDVDFSVVLPSEEASNELAVLAAARRYACQPTQTEGGTWDCMCTKRMVLTYQSVIDAQRELAELSEPIGGYVDGWGTFGNGQGVGPAGDSEGFQIVNGMGEALDSPTPEQMRAFLDEIDPEDEEHGAAWLSRGDLTLEWSVDGRMVRCESDDVARHLLDVDRARAVELWCIALSDDSKRLDDLPWRDGNGYVRSPEKAAELARALEASEREFYDSLGAERSDSPCRREGCERGAVQWSVFCRVHHYESLRGRPCKFTH